MVLLSFVIPSNVFSKTIYVDNLLGDDSASGISIESPWKTFAKANNAVLEPGDSILLRRSRVWEETLTIKYSGTKESPIYVGAYGEGDNPLIKCSTAFSKWSLAVNNGDVRVWKGSIDNVKNSWGAMKNNIKYPQYLSYYAEGHARSAPSELEDMENGYFYAPLNKSVFYLRNDAGNPGTIEIGSRKYSVHVINSSYVVVDSVDCYGLGGRNDSGSTTGFKQIIVENCNNVVVKNCTLSYHTNGGGGIINNSTNCSFENIKSFRHLSTGLYFQNTGEGNKAISCEVYLCGYSGTGGDKGLIGIWRSPSVTIEKCYLHDNGNSGIDHIDAAVSFVQSPNGSIFRSKVEDTGGVAIQFAEGSDNGIAAYNIIDRWGVFGASVTKSPSFAGIRIGGGSGAFTQTDCKVYNNLFINGGFFPGNWGAILAKNLVNKGLKVKNNIFYNNVGVYELHMSSQDNFEDWDISNNVYYRTSGDAIYWGGSKYNYTHIIGNKKGYYSYDKNQGTGSIVGNPKLTSDKKGLAIDSPCINTGVWVGIANDYYGNPVSSDEGVDIGPFEFQFGYQVPSPPQGIRVE